MSTKQKRPIIKTITATGLSEFRIAATIHDSMTQREIVDLAKSLSVFVQKYKWHTAQEVAKHIIANGVETKTIIKYEVPNN